MILFNFDFHYHFHHQHDGNHHQHADHHHSEPVEVVCLHVPLVRPSSRASRLSSCNTAPSADLSFFIIVPLFGTISDNHDDNHNCKDDKSPLMINMSAVWASALNKWSLWMVEQKVWSRCVHFCFDNMFWQKSQDTIMTHFCHLYGGKQSPVGKLRI